MSAARGLPVSLAQASQLPCQDGSQQGVGGHVQAKVRETVNCQRREAKKGPERQLSVMGGMVDGSPRVPEDRTDESQAQQQTWDPSLHEGVDVFIVRILVE